MALLPPQDRHIEGPDVFDLINNLGVNEYNKAYYIEKEGIHVDFAQELEDDEESQEEQVEELTSEIDIASPSPKASYSSCRYPILCC